MNDYRPGHQVHWIQARKASEDHESWKEGRLLSLDGTVVTVEFDDTAVTHFESAEAGLLVRATTDRVWVSERWSVLAVPDPEGNVVGIQPPGTYPDSVFDRAGTQRLRYLSITRTEPVEYV